MFFALLRRQLAICTFSYFVKMTADARQTYLTIATIMMALWSLKFLPPYVLAITVVVVACLVFIVKFIMKTPSLCGLGVLSIN